MLSGPVCIPLTAGLDVGSHGCSWSWMVWTVAGHFEQDISPLITKLLRQASIVLLHALTDKMQFVEGGAVQSQNEVLKRRV